MKLLLESVRVGLARSHIERSRHRLLLIRDFPTGLGMAKWHFARL